MSSLLRTQCLSNQRSAIVFSKMTADSSPILQALKLFAADPRIYFKDAVMKALPTSRTEIGWMALAVPLLFIGHWLLSGLCIELLRLVPESVRAIVHLL